MGFGCRRETLIKCKKPRNNTCYDVKSIKPNKEIEHKGLVSFSIEWARMAISNEEVPLVVILDPENSL